jgi:hypothetical protein
VHRAGHADVDTADRVGHVHNAHEVHFPGELDLQAGELADGLGGAGQASVVEGRVDRLGGDVLGVAVGIHAVWYFDDQVAREAHRDRVGLVGRHVQQDRDVVALALDLILGAAESALAHPCVRPDDEDVESALVRSDAGRRALVALDHDGVVLDLRGEPPVGDCRDGGAGDQHHHERGSDELEHGREGVALQAPVACDGLGWWRPAHAASLRSVIGRSARV